ncbi:type IV toxin-antitoxin system AbiEi family antitoxin domain-containing protein [Bradyrhizobium sp. CCBAU 11386]|uniref:type IV toxin-antitoxin system AbiEi family antitoxin domain-containing protein n=1 Tax=unclassified Bradyrhizobium TaxID=2631580 RepID=UPI003FA40DA6
MQKLLKDCAGVKVKRLFFFADRHKHPWLKRLDKEAVAGQRQAYARQRRCSRPRLPPNRS